MELPRTLDQPWTPPEMDKNDTLARSNYFEIYNSSPLSYPTSGEQRWLKDAHRVRDQPWIADKYNVNTPTSASRPKPSSRFTDPPPYTPTRPYYLNESNLGSKVPPRYPFTPESSQILQRSTELPSSPTLWDEHSEASSSPSSSPVQDALSSCISHFENLINTQEPDEDQMEYIVGQFEAMAAHLSTPEAHADGTNELYFSDPGQGLCIQQTEVKGEPTETQTQFPEAYVAEVGNYIEGVQKTICDLKKRLDEFKTLNSIQLDVIEDLRQQMRLVRQGMRDELDRGKKEQFEPEDTHHFDKTPHLEPKEFASQTPPKQDDAHADADEDAPGEFGVDSWQTLVDEEDVARLVQEEYTKLLRSTVDSLTLDDLGPLPPRPKRRHITIIRSPPRRSFWASFGEALDAMAELLLEE
ncbi:hypothetical protein CFE70_003258 [Pyrenophora teres f. teres 0-1]|uniref:Uncharacterized protein n=2 Tax=Pyrenophora teres f. teres TaxID=97479 RepID=E3RPW3_PYRTT|nr:hypothetical protein PTT_10710 [Pyrenophora teres f. teres 0-1]KAE8846270.1 hypothetical protein HRS9139_00837 [Pyrenophora teres f. teres]KAE8848410.1 hypothetical protein PTNB85_02253 [Pyrenophora teres f. teres]KAE8853424.1 hypothetical protein HRS9122_00416 [Pyrenophora teres f. teres]KAE8868335.1 hypothetical protein PTNB29_02246 [Pyrenophora teres f. teres]